MSELVAVFLCLCALRAERDFQREMTDVRNYDLTTRRPALARHYHHYCSAVDRLQRESDCECSTHDKSQDTQISEAPREEAP